MYQDVSSVYFVSTLLRLHAAHLAHIQLFLLAVETQTGSGFTDPTVPNGGDPYQTTWGTLGLSLSALSGATLPPAIFVLRYQPLMARFCATKVYLGSILSPVSTKQSSLSSVWFR